MPERRPGPPPKVRGTSSYGSAVTAASSSKTPPSPAAVSMDRGRRREKSFFDDLKQRLSFRKSGSGHKRAHSLEADINGSREAHEQSRLGGTHGQGVGEGRSVSTPASRDTSQTRRRLGALTLCSARLVSVSSALYAAASLLLCTLRCSPEVLWNVALRCLLLLSFASLRRFSGRTLLPRSSFSMMTFRASTFHPFLFQITHR